MTSASSPRSPVPGTPTNLLAAAGALWIGTLEGLALRVDPSTDRVEERWRLPTTRSRPGVVLASAGKRVWAFSTRAAWRIDPVTAKVVPARKLFRAQRVGVAVGAGLVWVAVT